MAVPLVDVVRVINVGVVSALESGAVVAVVAVIASVLVVVGAVVAMPIAAAALDGSDPAAVVERVMVDVIVPPGAP